MLNTSAKIYLTVAFLALVSAVGVGIVIGDQAAVTLLVFIAVGALFVGLAVAGSGVNDRARRVPADAPIERVPVGRAVLVKPSPWPLALGFGLAVLGLGAALGTPVVVAGLAVLLFAGAGWLGQAWRETPGWDTAKGARLSARFLAPFGIPVAAVILLALLVIPVSRVLLSVNEHVAVAVALATAVVILGLFSLLAITSRLTRRMSGAVIGVAVVALVAAGSAGIASGERQWENKNESDTEVLSLTAKNTTFDKNSLEAPADATFEVVFRNEDPGIYHNVAIYQPAPGQSASSTSTSSSSTSSTTASTGGATTSTTVKEKPVETGPPIRGVKKTTYRFKVASPGTYVFKCDFHANMTGTLTVGK